MKGQKWWVSWFMSMGQTLEFKIIAFLKIFAYRDNKAEV